MDEWNMIELNMIKRNLGQSRKKKYKLVYRHMKKTLKKPIGKTEKDDNTKFFVWLVNKDFSDETKKSYWCCYKAIIRMFHSKADFSDYQPRFKRVIKFPEDMPTMEEIVDIIKATESTRDRALLSVLYESGARVGEIINLKIKNIFFDSIGYTIIVYGKTGMRRIRMFGSANILKLHIEMHNHKNNPEAYLFYSMDKKINTPLRCNSINNIMKYYARKIGIQKRIYPYLFRHARATHLAKYFTESEMRNYFGWTQGSNMTSVYVHLSGRDIDEKLLKFTDEISLKI